MLHGPWREAGAPTVVLHIDDANVDSEAITIALAYLYGQPPKLNDNNTFRVLAAASFLDLQVYLTHFNYLFDIFPFVRHFIVLFFSLIIWSIAGLMYNMYRLYYFRTLDIKLFTISGKLLLSHSLCL
jgi:hypothetical protein